VLTNARGLYSKSLGEFIAMGLLFHTKQLRTYLTQQAAHQWKQGFIENVYTKTVLIVGYGNIGAACGKIIKNGFGAKVIGLKLRPEQATEDQIRNADEIVGVDQLDRVISLADFVVAVLPTTT
jgi:phosphoglycerate dehydrogenase-like enzyme